jgi:hypothetical protein
VARGWWGLNGVSLGVVSGAWTRVRLYESRCGDRQNQEEKRLPAHPRVKVILGWRLAEVSALAGFVLLRGRTAGGRGDVRCLGGLADVGEGTRFAVGDEGYQSHRLPTAWAQELGSSIPQR